MPAQHPYNAGFLYCATADFHGASISFGQKIHAASRSPYMSKPAGSLAAANRASSIFAVIFHDNRHNYVTAVRTA
jgi:hypothetical protein